MSLPPAKWSARVALQQTVQQRIERPVWNLVLSTAWSSRNHGVRERFRTELSASPLEPIWYQTEDGWRAPIWRYPAKPGSSGEPVILATGMGLNPRSLDLDEGRSLVRSLHTQGFDVFVLTHRGSAEAVPPGVAPDFDFDDVVTHDVSAAIRTVRETTGAHRVHWVGHGLGGQLLLGHLAHDGHRDIAAGVTLCAPASFDRLHATVRRIAAVARWVPSHWHIPVRQIQDILTAASRPADLVHVTRRIEGPIARSLLIDGTENLPIGLIKQIARWHEVGSLVNRNNRFDYTAALEGRSVHLMSIAAPDDPFCSPKQAHTAVKALAPGFGESWTLDRGWSHLDPIAGADAARIVHPRIAEWLQQHHDRCWTAS
jgi:predicted alpha/beta hydrolase